VREAFRFPASDGRAARADLTQERGEDFGDINKRLINWSFTVRSAEGSFNCKIGLIWFKTDILLKFYNFFFYVHFFPLSFRRKKKETNQRKKKETGAIIPRKTLA
jgi:hypothetical protein